MITKIEVQASVAALIKDFGAMQQKQLPFALRDAMNASVVDSQSTVQLAMKRSFSAGPAGMKWIQRHVKVIKVGARLGREYGGSGGAALAVIPPGGAKLAGWERYRGSLVAMMEAGGLTPGPKRFGGRAGGAMSDFGRYAIPIRRPGHPQPYPRSLYPVNLGLSSRTGISGRRAVGGGLRGKHRTYLVPMRNNPGHSMVFQRFGKQRDDSQPLFWIQQQTRVPARPYFFANAQRVITVRFGVHFPAAMEHALFGRGAYRG